MTGASVQKGAGSVAHESLWEAVGGVSVNGVGTVGGGGGGQMVQKGPPTAPGSLSPGGTGRGQRGSKQGLPARTCGRFLATESRAVCLLWVGFSGK